MTLTRRREWLLRLILLCGSLGFALGVSELVVRAFFPLSDGRDNVTLTGERISDWFPPGIAYRQVSNEYNALTTITDKRHRVPGTSGNPELIFLGDSFTYGYGLSDEETFAAIYCGRTGKACANLGIPGSGTARQVARLRSFIETYGWRPREVKLFFFGMSGSFSAGNDFADNYDYGERREPAAADGPRPKAQPSLGGRLIAWQSSLMEYSYLVRRAKYHWGPMLKSLVVNAPGDRLERSLQHTRAALADFDGLATQYGFDYTVYLIVPVQDLIRRTDQDTLAALNQVSPRPAVSTAPALADAPSRYYYSFDGHLNPEGSRRVAEFVLDGEGRRGGQ